MNYIEQINLLHKIRRKDSLSPIAVALHVVLLDICNSNDWENPLSLKNDRIMSDLDVTFKILTAARNQLQQAGLIRFKTKNGSAFCVYEILTPIKTTSARTSALKAKVRAEVRAEVWDEVTAEVRDEPIYSNKQKPKPKPKPKNTTAAKPPAVEKIEDVEPAEKMTSVHTVCIEIYHQWFLRRFEIGPKIDALQGKAMKDLINYFRLRVKERAEKDQVQLTDEEIDNRISENWRWLLDNWDNLEQFYQQKTKLNEISSNIQNLIVQIKSKNSGQHKSKNDGAGAKVPIWRQ